MNKQLAVSQSAPTPVKPAPLTLRKKFVTNLSQIMKYFNQGMSFLSSGLWVTGTFIIVFLVPLSAAIAVSGPEGATQQANAE
jgi:hypothetical protein